VSDDGSDDVGDDVSDDASGSVARRLADIRRRIDATDRPFDHRVDVVAVTKGFPGWAIEAAVGAGCRLVGENYAQEVVEKRTVIERSGAELHFIGRLQTNKVRQLVGLVQVWSSLDRASVIDEVAKRAPGSRVLVQVDTTGDPAKGGCAVAMVGETVARCVEQGLRVEGLMTVGPTDAPAEAARDGFRAVRALTDELGLAVCSMGMSGDLEIAVQEGSTQLRIGTALFGARPPRV
jgi:pyridoxal phosphate enzyme (YggS family)